MRHGVDVMQALFPYEDPVDKDVRINGNPFHVIGVMEPLGNFFGQSRDNSIFVPITTFDKYYPESTISGSRLLRSSCGRVSRAYVKSAMDEITDILRRSAACRRARRTTSASRRRTRCWTFTTS